MAVSFTGPGGTGRRSPLVGSPDIYAIRGRLSRAQADAARAEGETATLAAEVDGNMAKLRALLGCKVGKEKEAIQALRESVEKGAAELDALLTKAEAIRDGRTA